MVTAAVPFAIIERATARSVPLVSCPLGAKGDNLVPPVVDAGEAVVVGLSKRRMRGCRRNDRGSSVDTAGFAPLLCEQRRDQTPVQDEEERSRTRRATSSHAARGRSQRPLSSE